MERLDFASVMAVLRRNIPDENFGNQADFLDSLFIDMGFSPQTAMEFDQGQVCRWINGLARLSPNIISFYQDSFNQRKLVSRIKNMLLPMMPDSAMAAQELYDLVLQAPNVSPQKKMELTDGYTFEDENDEAIFILDVLCLAMQLRFEKRDVRKKQLLTPGNLSPAVVDYIFDTDIPRPCRWFLGRETELDQLHGLLVDHSKVFLHGIPGIGKSELAKAYAKRYGKEYTNVIYVNYPGDLKQAVIDLDFADAMEKIRSSMLIFSYQLRHIGVGKHNMGRRVKAVKPELERYAGLLQQIKDKSKERKALLAEKKETPFYQIPKLHDLTRRITELTEELEELKTEKEMLLRSLDCADDAGISAVKKEIATLEGALQNIFLPALLKPEMPDNNSSQFSECIQPSCFSKRNKTDSHSDVMHNTGYHLSL